MSEKTLRKVTPEYKLLLVKIIDRIEPPPLPLTVEERVIACAMQKRLSGSKCCVWEETLWGPSGTIRRKSDPPRRGGRRRAFDVAIAKVTWPFYFAHTKVDNNLHTSIRVQS